jgi:hypothetical protein
MTEQEAALPNAHRLSARLDQGSRACPGIRAGSQNERLQSVGESDKRVTRRQSMRSAEVLAILDSKGIRIHRETLARVSDELCLRTRPSESPPGTHREWSEQQVDELVAHFRAEGWTPMMPMRRRDVAHSSGPFRSGDVLAHLEGLGYRLHRETLARVSDALGLRTRDEEAPTVQREWSRAQVDHLVEHLSARRTKEEHQQRERDRLEELERLRERERLARLARLRCLHRRLDVAADSLAGLTVEDVCDAVEADPSLAERLQPFVDAFFAARGALTGSSPSTASPQTRETEEAA